MRLLCASILATFLLLYPLMADIGPHAVITAPLARQVLQREGFDPNFAHEHQPGGPILGFADVRVAARIPGITPHAQVAYRIVVLPSAFGRGCDWTTLEAKVHGEELTAILRVPAGGWYRLELRCVDSGRTSETSLEPFGVGEVFLIAGQSYATSAHDERQKIEDPQGRVVAYDVMKKTWATANDPLPNVGARGSIWPGLGNFLLPLARVPIGFVNVARGGTASRQWMPGEKLYENLASTGSTIGQFRAVLWQQGESDVIEKTPTEKYVERLSRTHAIEGRISW